jgi:hypothetical protein
MRLRRWACASLRCSGASFSHSAFDDDNDEEEEEEEAMFCV